MPFTCRSACRTRPSRQHRHPQLLRLVQLAAGVRAGDHVVRLLRHAAGRLAAERLDQLLDLLAARSAPASRSPPASCRPGQRRPPPRPRDVPRSSVSFSPSSLKSSIMSRVGRQLEVLADRLRPLRADALDLRQPLLGRGQQRVDATGTPGPASSAMLSATIGMPSPASSRARPRSLLAAIPSSRFSAHLPSDFVLPSFDLAAGLEQVLLRQPVQVGSDLTRSASSSSSTIASPRPSMSIAVRRANWRSCRLSCPPHWPRGAVQK